MTIPETIRCWRCQSEVPVALLCSRCEAIQPLPSQLDYFRVLGVGRNPALDESALASRYYELSRRLHPDLYQTASAQEREASLHNSALVNRAYRTLRNPVQRGVYWLELHGEKLGANNNRVPPQLASLVFAVQEQLEELRDARRAGQQAEVDDALSQLRTQLEEQRAQSQAALTRNFSRWHDDLPETSALLAELKSVLSEMAYLRTLLRDVEKENEVSWNA
jgi:molecular chaperone HscB